MQYYLEAFGIREVETRFERMGVAASFAQPAMATVLTRIMEIIALTFESQGRRGGGSWPADTQSWLERKQREGLDPRIQHATLALRRSMTEPGADFQDMKIGRNYAKVGSLLEYAETAQYHRPFVKLTKTDRTEIRKIIRDYLIKAWRAKV
jgi:phage gpG-like protein